MPTRTLQADNIGAGVIIMLISCTYALTSVLTPFMSYVALLLLM